MGKREGNESFSMGREGAILLANLQALTGISKTELVRQGLRMLALSHSLHINPVLYTDSMQRNHEAYHHLKQYLKEFGGCDHAVNICCCGEKTLLKELRAVLEKGGVDHAADPYLPKVP